MCILHSPLGRSYLKPKYIAQKHTARKILILQYNKPFIVDLPVPTSYDG